jgi:hypothetical protein
MFYTSFGIIRTAIALVRCHNRPPRAPRGLSGRALITVLTRRGRKLTSEIADPGNMSRPIRSFLQSRGGHCFGECRSALVHALVAYIRGSPGNGRVYLVAKSLLLPTGRFLTSLKTELVCKF